MSGPQGIAVYDPFATAGGEVVSTEINVQAAPYLTPSNGVASAVAGILAALAAVPATGANVRFPAGTYLLDGAGVLITVSKKNTRLVFDAGVIFKVAPTAAVTAIKASAGASILYGFGFIGYPAFTSTNTTFTKTALELSDTSGAEVEITVGPEGGWHDAGLTSIGLLIKGRDLGCVTSPQGIAADRPIVITDNPNSYIDLDRWRFGIGKELLLIANGHPNIEIGDCYASNSVISASCNKGTDGLVFNGATNPTASTNNSVFNLRHEQGTDPNGYAVKWAPAFSKNTSVAQCAAGTPNKGFRFRNSAHTTFALNEYNLGAGVSFDIDGSVDHFLVVNGFDIDTSAPVLSGVMNVFTLGQFASGPTGSHPIEYYVSLSNANAVAAPLSLLQEFRATTVGASLAGVNAATLTVPGLSGNAVHGKFLLLFSGAGDGAAEFAFTTAGLYPIGGAANLPTNITVGGAPAANHVGVVFNSAGSISIFNNYATPIAVRISATYFF